jgi:cholesterol oxidase
VRLLFQCKEKGSLPRLSDQLGSYVRTNSEAILAARANDATVDYSHGIAITSGVHPDENTHVEIVRYGKGQDFMGSMMTLLTSGEKPWPKWMRWVGNMVRHPIRFLRATLPWSWAQRSAIILVMQPIDSYMKLRMKNKPWGRSLDSELEEGQSVPTYMPLANELAARLAKKMNGTPQSLVLEVLGNTSSMAHILGGATMARNPAEGVCDAKGRIFGYDDMYVADGSIVPANLGVNPLLTITALSEYVMSGIPDKPGAETRPAPRPPPKS